MSEVAVSEAIHTALDTAQRPSLIFCTTGKVKTSCVVACLRKHNPFRWSTVSAIAGIIYIIPYLTHLNHLINRVRTVF